MRFHIPYASDKVLFEVMLEPPFPALNKLAKELDAGEGEIGKARGKKARVSVGVPYYENLISRLAAQKEEVPHDIRMMLPKYDFHFVSLSCSFLPDRNCKLVWARFGVNLSATSNSVELINENPVAYDIFPDEVVNESAYERDVSFEAGFKLNLGVINTDAKFSKANKTKEAIVYEPKVFAFGIGRSNPGWNFESNQERGIWGNKKNLFLIIKSPKNSKVRGSFILGAEAEIDVERSIRLPLARSHREDKIVEIEYNLSE